MPCSPCGHMFIERRHLCHKSVVRVHRRVYTTHLYHKAARLAAPGGRILPLGHFQGVTCSCPLGFYINLRCRACSHTKEFFWAVDWVYWFYRYVWGEMIFLNIEPSQIHDHFLPHLLKEFRSPSVSVMF